MRKRKYVTTAIFAAALCANTVTANAASLEQVRVKGCPESLYQAINESKSFQNIPDEVMKLFSEKGGSITFKDRLSHNDKEVNGLYHDGGSKDCQIEMSLSWANQGFPGMTAYDLTHEIGHFVYFHTDFTESESAVLKSMYQKFQGYASSINSIEETFASQYALWKDGGYGMLDEEKAMFESVEMRLLSTSEEAYSSAPNIPVLNQESEMPLTEE